MTTNRKFTALLVLAAGTLGFIKLAELVSYLNGLV